MADNYDDNRIGPPVAALPGTAPQAARPAPTDEQDEQRLARVRGTVQTLTDLVAAVREVDDRSQALERERRQGKVDGEPADVARIWDSALEPLSQYLSQHVQLAAGERPVQLAEAVGRLEPWARSFADNAAGPDGHGLQQDPARLAAFEAKLQAIDPDPAWLEQEGQRLLSRPELDPDVVRRSVAATKQALTDDRERQHGIDETMASLAAEWDASVAPLEDRLHVLERALTGASLDSSRSPQFRADAGKGLAALKTVDLGALVERRASLGEWVDKYRADREFGADQIRTRVNQELRPLLRQTQQRVESLEHEFAVSRLEAADRDRAEATHRTVTAAITQLLGQVRNRYQALVSLRRTKLGQEPDERFFGEIAKQVNSAITNLGNLEADLVAASMTPPASEARQQLEARTKQLLGDSARFSDSHRLDELLRERTAKQHAEEAQLEAKAKRDEILRRGREIQAEKQRAQREEREAKAAEAQQAVATLAKQTAQQAAVQQQLRGYLAELQMIEREQQARAQRVTHILEEEQRLIAIDQQRFAEQRAERRSLTATEAGEWLKALNAAEATMAKRQHHISTLTTELAAIRSSADRSARIAELEQQLAGVGAPATSGLRPDDPRAEDSNQPLPANSRPVPIPISRRP